MKSISDPKISISFDEIETTFSLTLESGLNQYWNEGVVGEIKESGFLEQWQKLNEKLSYSRIFMSD